MSAEDMVDAALVGFDQGEPVTRPSLHDGDEWTRFEAARCDVAAIPRFRTCARIWDWRTYDGFVDIFTGERHGKP